MTRQQLQSLYDDYVADGNYVHRVRQGYKTIKWNADNDPAHEPRAAFSSHLKTNPHVKRRFSDE
jgi:hypothetical protein